MATILNDPWVHVLESLLAAFALGAVIGFERQYRERSAGLRTNVLVAIGAALFVNVSIVSSGTMVPCE